jgi:hypothetical protein
MSDEVVRTMRRDLNSVVARVFGDDEIREIAPGVYLGLVYVRSRRVPVRFSLEFESAASST